MDLDIEKSLDEFKDEAVQRYKKQKKKQGTQVL